MPLWKRRWRNGCMAAGRLKSQTWIDKKLFRVSTLKILSVSLSESDRWRGAINKRMVRAVRHFVGKITARPRSAGRLATWIAWQ